MTSHNVDIPTIPASLWNSKMDEIARRLPIVFETAHDVWSHPWKVSVEWLNPDDSRDGSKGWVFSVNPGFVNGEHYECSTKADLVSDETIDRLQSDGSKIAKSDDVTAWGIESPKILIPGTRLIGSGGDPSVSVSSSGKVVTSAEAVPKFFRGKGVGPSLRLGGNLNSGIHEIVGESQPEPRVLRAFDIVMRLDRSALRIDTGTIEQSSVAGYTQLLTIAVGRSSPANPRPQIYATPRYIVPRLSNPSDLLEGVSDHEFDELKIATVFFLSQAGESFSSELDGSWTSYVQHSVFWNLAHAPASIPVLVDAKPITVTTGLVGGLGDAVGNQILSPLNDAYAAAVTSLSARTLKGSFWTV